MVSKVDKMGQGKKNCESGKENQQNRAREVKLKTRRVKKTKRGSSKEDKTGRGKKIKNAVSKEDKTGQEK